ncbi:sacsin [Entomortierella parvispora]|uniref:Sacsin n=1 Tax=Entomortierella parvispora TaxID=205924 RepID=A0A9P3HDP2_9FUNG|nr:sacsin [Entomortierella parvispora]
MTVHPTGNFTSFEVFEPLTRRVAGILQEYPDGTQIARELLQNSEDACSRVQWYLLDHQHHPAHPKRLFNPAMQAYQGPALLAGNDSLFEQGDFKSLRNLAASGKKDDERKIGQMGIGFNSVYHMTDTPSFISGDQLVIVEPHMRIFDGIPFHGGVQGSFTDNGQGLKDFPGQLELFAIKEKIDFSKPYNGTIFRFPLRTREQAQVSELSKSAYPPEKVREMLMNLKNEAIKCLLFLKYIERMVIYERRESDPTVHKLFEIEIVNVDEVRAQREAFMAQLRSHVHASDHDDRTNTLQYSIRPVFRLTEEDGSVKEEEWAVVGYIGNLPEARQIMKSDYKADIAGQRMIPWVGLAAPVDSSANVGLSNLFCFLPLAIHTPHPVHINGHFAVKQSRREIWTNHSDDIASQSSQGIKSSWNQFLCERILPVAYMKLLDSIGTDHGANYELWPRFVSNGFGMDFLWKDLLTRCIKEVVLNNQLRVFFADSSNGRQHAVSYQHATIADPAMNKFPLLLDLLRTMTNLVCGVPEEIAYVLRSVVEDNGVQDNILTPQKVRRLLREAKEHWRYSTSNEAKTQILEYCIHDGKINDLEGLPLLPMADGSWVEFRMSFASSRYFTDEATCRVLQFANDGIVNTNLKNLSGAKVFFQGAGIFMSNLQHSTIVSKIRESLDTKLYYNQCRSPLAISQPTEGVFLSDEWIMEVWGLLHKSNLSDATLKPLLGCHLVPTEGGLLAPLKQEQKIIHRSGFLSSHLDSDRVLSLLGITLECSVVRNGLQDEFSWWNECFVSVTDVGTILLLLEAKSDDIQVKLDQSQRKTLCDYISGTLSSRSTLGNSQRWILGKLPIYQGYISTEFVPLSNLSGREGSKICLGFSSHDHPWELTSIALLRGDQPMSSHLRNIFKVDPIQQPEYWHNLFSQGNDFGDQWNEIMATFLPNFSRHGQLYDFRPLLKKAPFVDAQSLSATDERTIKLPPAMAVTRDLSQFVLQDEDIFPAGMYNTPDNLAVLACLGMTTQFSLEFIVNRLQKFSSLSEDTLNNNSMTMRLISEFFARLNAEIRPQHLENGAFVECAKNLTWVPARSRDDGHIRLYKPSQCRPQAESLIIGSQLPASSFVCTNGDLKSLLGWSGAPPLEAVLAHLVDLSIQRSSGNIPDNFEESIHAIYRNLNVHIKDPRSISIMKSTLASRQCILVNRRLYRINRVVIKSREDCNLAPYLIQVPDSDFVELFRSLGVRNEATITDMEAILAKVNSSYKSDDILSKPDADLALRILETIAKGKKAESFSPDLLVLTERSQLRKLSEVVYNDMAESNEIQELTSEEVFCNNRISKSTASMLLIPMLSQKIWNGCDDEFFQNWDQQVDVVSMIKGILNDYGPDNIFTEFLQNAADAGATKFSVMLDHQSYVGGRILSEKMSAGQGPALLIWNDAEFSDKDFNGLRKMAMGSKGDDPKKIGRHGLGFNSAYHVTDLPSVVSGRYIIILDPKREYLPQQLRGGKMVSDGAIRIDFINTQLAQKFPGQVAPYQGRFGCDMKSHFPGTLFRLPLRKARPGQTTQASSAFNELWEVAAVKKMLDQWAEDAKISLLFLDQIMKVEVHASDNDKLQVEKDSDPFKEGRDVVKNFRKVRIRSFGPWDRLLTTSVWLVGIYHVFPEDASPIRDTAARNRWIPHRGIAIPLELPKEEAGSAFKGRVFSYLPTSITTDHPFHIHGVFALLSSRKGLVTSSTDNHDGALWNGYMLRELLPPLLIRAMVCLLRYKFDRLDSAQTKGPVDKSFHYHLNSYFDLWPLRSNGDTASMVIRFWELAHKSSVFPILHQKSENGPAVLGISGEKTRFPMTHLKSPPAGAMRKLEQLLRDTEVAYCECASSVIKSAMFHWGKLSLPVTQVDAGLIRKVLPGHDDFMVKIVSEDGRDWMLELLLGVLVEPGQEGIDHLHNLPLLPLQDGTWAKLSPTSEHYTANPAARILIKNHKDLVKESIFRSSSTRLKILKALEKDTRYGVKTLTPAKFTEYICTENSGGIPAEKLPRLWEYIRGCGPSDWVGFGDLPILKTIWGTLVPLKDYQGALKIDPGQRIDASSMIIKLGPTLQRAGVIVFKWEDNDKNKMLEKNQPGTNANVISAFIKKGGSLSGMELSTAEATTMRDAIIQSAGEIGKSTLVELGHLRIWPSFGTSGALICAQGNLLIDGDYDIRNLGDSHDVINFRPDKRSLMTFKTMGVRTITLTQFTRDRIIPRLQSQAFKPTFTAANMSAYTSLLEKLVKIASDNSLQRGDARTLLQSGKLILARDNSIHSSDELYDPTDGLLTLIHGGKSPGRFPHANVWTILQAGKNSLTKVRQSSDDRVLIECADAVLEEIQARPHATQTKGMAKALVGRIYNKPSSANWMLAKWTFVPVSPLTFELHGPLAPILPAYMSFSDLVLDEYRDVVWTQCGFFPEDLQPPPTARKIWRTVGEPRVRSIVDHLHSLVRDIAPKWSLESEQLKLQMMLHSTYQALNKFAEKSPSQMSELTDLLKTVPAPYLYNSFDKDMTDRSAWFFPMQLILDVENSTATHQLVHPKLTPYRSFLIAAGVRKMARVDFKIAVAPVPSQGDFMNLLSNYFESQDYVNGFMDVCFRFDMGQCIYAHKIVLAHWSDHFRTRFLGPWGENGGRDPEHPSVEVIDVSQLESGDHEFYSAFWGVVYYLYKHRLTPWNGPPAPVLGSGVGATATSLAQEDFLAERVQYLLSLLALADEYRILRLKDLIADELVSGDMIIHGNVFEVREHVELRSYRPLVEFCDKYIKTNAESLKSFVLGEIVGLQNDLQDVQSKNGAEVATMKDDLEGHKRHLVVIAEIAAK